MAGTIIADYIRTDANKLSLNVGNTTFATINAGGFYSNTGVQIINQNGLVTLVDGQVTTAKLANNTVGNGPVWSTQRVATQTISTSTWTRVLFDTVNYDTNSFVNLGSYRVQPTISGYYQLTASANFSTGTGTTIVSVRLNTGEYMRMSRIPLTTTDETNNCYSCLMPIQSTDYIELWVYQSNASSITLYNGTLQGSLVRKL